MYFFYLVFLIFSSETRHIFTDQKHYIFIFICRTLCHGLHNTLRSLVLTIIPLFLIMSQPASLSSLTLIPHSLIMSQPTNSSLLTLIPHSLIMSHSTSLSSLTLIPHFLIMSHSTSLSSLTFILHLLNMSQPASPLNRPIIFETRSSWSSSI